MNRGRAAILGWRQRLLDAGRSEAACAEFPKAAIGEGELAVGYADLLADRCAAGGDSAGIVAPRAWLSRRSAAHALRARGMRASWSRGRAWIDALSMLVAGLVAWCTLLYHAIVHAPVLRQPPTGAWWLAVHGEWSNRTRHVLPAAHGQCPPAAILLLGRPRSRIADVESEWTSRMGVAALPMLVRPWTLAGVLRSWPSACAAVLEAMRIAVDAPYLPPFRERTAILYRTCIGLASARWWRRLRERPARIVYGHTGNADTTLLELAQQASGRQTWHVVHGVSAGLNFTGRSSVAVFACAHDARWHQSLGGYGRCLHLPAPMPTVVSGASGLLLLTNYAHPMNVECRVSGIAAEEGVLRAVSAAARQCGVGDDALHWRPHPALAQLGQGEQDALRWIAGQLGFHALPSARDWLAQAREARWVVTTASTVAIQLLEAGIVPIVLIPDWLDPACALARHPLAVRDLASLPEVLAGFDRSGSTRVALLAAAWQAIGPGRPATPADWME